MNPQPQHSQISTSSIIENKLTTLPDEKVQDDFSLGVKLYNLGLYYQALKHFNECLSLQPCHDKAGEYQAILLEKITSFERCINELQDNAFWFSPNDSVLFFHHNILFFESKPYSELISYQEALQLYVNLRNSYSANALSFLRAKLLFKLHRHEEANQLLLTSEQGFRLNNQSKYSNNDVLRRDVLERNFYAKNNADETTASQSNRVIKK